MTAEMYIMLNDIFPLAGENTVPKLSALDCYFDIVGALTGA